LSTRTIDASRLSDLFARLVIGILFILFSIQLLEDFQKTRHVTGLLLLISEALIVPLTILRRRALAIDRSIRAATVTAIAIAGPPLLRPMDGGALVPDALTALVSSCGLALVIAGKVTLGRSFGIVPANRGVVTSGPYLVVRHPIYTGYIIGHLAFVVAHPSLWNVIVLLIADVALVRRALLEERVLAQDAHYQGYCNKVGWHLVPGVF
jgi:protein-S-isoprenylcysteine O-methyltransferase Ste14